MEKFSIQEIEELLFKSQKGINKNIQKQLKNDRRKGVQVAFAKWIKQQEKQAALMKKYDTLQVYEKELRNQGLHLIAGIDEVGRGPLAGPVVAAAVILPDDANLIGIDDSKKLSEEKRNYFYSEIIKQAIAVGIGKVSSKVIDEINIYQATILAMKEAVENLGCKPEHLLIDAMTLPFDITQTKIIKGDAKSISIAAASIIAKVTRDRLMKELDVKHPGYGFATNMGYGTSEHLKALNEFGPIDEHRFSFQPVQTVIFEKALG